MKPEKSEKMLRFLKQISPAPFETVIQADVSGWCLRIPFIWHLEDFVIPMRQRRRPRPQQPAENHGPVVVTKLDDNKDDIFINIYYNSIICMAMGRDAPTKLPIWEKKVGVVRNKTLRDITIYFG